MTYDGMLVMPSSYAVMNEEEMIYVEGGDNSYRMSLNDAKSYFTFVAASAAAFASGCAVIPQAALQIFGSSYYAHLASSAMGCLNQCKGWLKKYKSSKLTRVTEYTVYGIITGYSVNL